MNTKLNQTSFMLNSHSIPAKSVSTIHDFHKSQIMKQKLKNNCGRNALFLDRHSKVADVLSRDGDEGGGSLKSSEPRICTDLGNSLKIDLKSFNLVLSFFSTVLKLKRSNFEQCASPFR